MMLLHLATVIVTLFTTEVRADGQNGINSNCGKRLILHRGLIANGADVAEGDWPWHAAILHIGKDYQIQYKCGGTLLNSNSVLTAAHCVIENDQLIIFQRILVNLGQISLVNPGSSTQHFDVYNVIPHPNYGADFSDDIAIIRLATEAKFNKFVQPICLWDSTKSDISEVVGKFGTVVGWGITENDKISYVLQQAFMPVQPHLTCLVSNRDFFGSYLTENNFCAGLRNGTSVCQGDSGGSMVFEENGVYRIRGIVSLVYKRIGLDKPLCNVMDYVIFTDVAKYLTWIEEAVKQSPSAPLEVDTQRRGPLSKLLPAPGVCGANNRIDKFPWTVLIEYTKITEANTRSFLCGGVLISDRYVLIAAYCAHNFKERGWDISNVRLGERGTNSTINCDKGDCSNLPIDVPVEEVIAHEKYNQNSRLQEDNIALIRLSRSVTYTDFIKPICLPGTEISNNINYGGKNLDLVGWRKTEDASFTNSKVKEKVLGVDVEQCNSIYRQYSINISDTQLCAHELKEVESCQADSYLNDGILMTIDRSNPKKPYWYCAGIPSYVITTCGEDVAPIVYARVSSYTDWISSNILV